MKALNIIRVVVTWLLVAIAIFMMVFTIISVTTFNRADRSFLGLKAFIAQSDSMKATDFKAGDLVVSTAVNPNDLQVGDIITFQSTNDESYGEIVTHKIRSITKTQNGQLAFVTYGTSTNKDDGAIVPASMVIGQYRFSIPNVGYFFQFLKTPMGYIVLILLPFLLLIALNFVNAIRLFRRYKKEQYEEIEEERKKITEERKRTEDMMTALLQMKEEMAGNAGAISQPALNVQGTGSADYDIEALRSDLRDNGRRSHSTGRAYGRHQRRTSTPVQRGRNVSTTAPETQKSSRKIIKVRTEDTAKHEQKEE